MGPQVAELLVPGPSDADAGAATPVELSPREHEVLALIAEGRSGREIAIQLDLSARALHGHRMSLMRKLGAHSLVVLLRRALELGLLNHVVMLVGAASKR
jgi:DNA-binding CsgD family transcriptional regulator